MKPTLQLVDVIDPHERLVECEAVIERGLATFVEVGQALAEIRDRRLYKTTHQTFESYCHERWNFSASRGRQMIGAARAVTSGNAPGAQTEREARRLTHQARESAKPPSAAARVLSDYTDPDAKENPRTQLVEWFNQGRLVHQLLQDGGKIEPRSEDDRQALLYDAGEMIRLAKAFKRRLPREPAAKTSLKSIGSR